jgi:hypothetical protein
MGNAFLSLKNEKIFNRISFQIYLGKSELRKPQVNRVLRR